jgi:hypothetical protein
MKNSREVFNASAARQEIAELVGYGNGQCSADDTQWVIQQLLIQEIKRLRQDNARLNYAVQNYLQVFEKQHGKLTI